MTEAPVFKCPECGREFSEAKRLGAHRRTHGVVGTSDAAIRARKQTAARKAAASNSVGKPVFGREAQGMFDVPGIPWPEKPVELEPVVPTIIIVSKTLPKVASRRDAFEVILDHIDDITDGEPLPDGKAMFTFEDDGLEYTLTVEDKREN